MDKIVNKNNQLGLYNALLDSLSKMDLRNAIVETKMEGIILEASIKTADSAENILVMPGFCQQSRGNIKGLPKEKKKRAVDELKKRGYKQEDIAKKLNVSQSTVSRLQNGK